MRTAIALVAAIGLIAGSGGHALAASSGVTKKCNRSGNCTTTVTATQTKETTQTQRTYIPGSPGTPVWGPQPGNPQQVNAPARPLTAAEKLAIRQAGIRQDIYGEQAPRGCGVFPMAPCPPEQTPTVQQASAPGTPGRRVAVTTVSIDEVVARAKAKIQLPKPKIGSAPCTDAGCKGTVGVPTWFWLDGNEWQPRSDTASAGGHSVTVTAKPSKVVWHLGDGQSVTCTGPGTKYVESMGWATSPDCGLPNGYKKTGTYTVTADLTYDVTVSGDANETETVTRSSSEDVTVREVQTVIN